MHKIQGLLLTVLVLAGASLTMCRKAEPFPEDSYDARLSGGAATAFDETSHAFGHAVEGLNGRDLRVHQLGDIAFEQTFVTAPAPVNAGLGPLFNNVSCISCHHNDGKGTPTAGTVSSSLLFKISAAGADAHGGPLSVPGFGGQLQDVGIFGKSAEARIDISYTETPFTYPDGVTVQLRKPFYAVNNTYIPLPAGFALSPRLAPPVFGLGLLEAIPESTILSFADEEDANKDGISGKANLVYDPVAQVMALGRFGLKANTANLLAQVAGAYHQDIGVTSMIFPRESIWGQSQLETQADAGPELPDSTLAAAKFYVKTLAVPARRNVTDATIKAGEALFASMNCSGCHKPTIQTGIDLAVPAISNQRIHPYTDLLLHDMGAGLSDGFTDYRAGGSEWRTATLWGIGLFEKTNGIPFFLHDGRARSIEEAILWHGGEAEGSRNAFANLSKVERSAVIRFLKSL